MLSDDGIVDAIAFAHMNDEPGPLIVVGSDTGRVGLREPGARRNGIKWLGDGPSQGEMRKQHPLVRAAGG